MGVKLAGKSAILEENGRLAVGTTNTAHAKRRGRTHECYTDQTEKTQSYWKTINPYSVD